MCMSEVVLHGKKHQMHIIVSLGNRTRTCPAQMYTSPIITLLATMVPPEALEMVSVSPTDPIVLLALKLTDQSPVLLAVPRGTGGEESECNPVRVTTSPGAACAATCEAKVLVATHVERHCISTHSTDSCSWASALQEAAQASGACPCRWIVHTSHLRTCQQQTTEDILP
jgi:hypothetical protein